MHKKNIIIKYFSMIAVCIIFMLINNKIRIISIPSDKDMADYQFNMFTISSVFAGFAFTMLGMLLGMSSENLIKRIRKTDIITHKCEKIVFCLICFCSSGIFSLVLILGIDVFLDKILKKVGEECAETIIAAKNGDKTELIGEINDVFYHMMVMMNECGVTLEDICKEMDLRAEKIGNLKKFHVSDHNT